MLKYLCLLDKGWTVGVTLFLKPETKCFYAKYFAERGEIMSNIADAKKKREEIENKLRDQKTYSGLSEAQRLELFQEYVKNIALSSEDYYANEAENEKNWKKI